MSISDQNPRDFKHRPDRRRVLNGAKIVFNNGASVIDCIVRDMSMRGAKVRLSRITVLPTTEVDLLINKDFRVYPAKVCWIKGTDAGLRFTR